jgi:molecular chaperone DnaK (HSP70)
MAGRLAIDFGTSNTVVAVWDEALGEGVPLLVPDYGRVFEHDGSRVPVVPSLIHYSDDRRQLVGQQVHAQGVSEAATTFRWMKRYIACRSPVWVRCGVEKVTHFDAGRDFLSAVMTFAAIEAGGEDEEIALTLPVEGFEHYQEWLAQAAAAAGMPRFRTIDEASAAALGYGAHIQPGNVYVVFDFGGGTLDVAVVLITDEEESAGGRRCRVLGKAGVELGGATIDGWIFQDVLARSGRGDADDDVRQLSRALLAECERAKETLSTANHAEIGVVHPHTGATIGAELTRAHFEQLLDDHDALARIDKTIRRAMAAARERGYDEDAVSAVLMVGGSSLIPAVQTTLRRIFGRERVLIGRPLDAVARGAAAFVAGVDFYDHIQHDYAIRWLNRERGEHEYRLCVARGTPYPNDAPMDDAEWLTIKASHDGQTHLGIAMFELGEARDRAGGNARVELVQDPSGAWRLSTPSADVEEDRSRFWINEHTPTFLEADPPATAGERRFRLKFGIDGNKRLLITALDLRTGKTTHRDYPVVKLT